jgi:two-component system heavy metal sensor histidine kinase CusS
MFSRRTESRSIASHLVLLFTLAAALLLSCGLGVFYWIVLRHAFAEDNAVLADKISAVSADFNENGPDLFGEELKARRAGDHAAYWIRVLDSEGHTLTETPGMERLLPPGVFPPAQKTTSSIGGPKNYRTGMKLFSLVAVNEKTGGQTYIIQLAQDRSSDEQL